MPINGNLVLFKIGEDGSETVLACSTSSSLTLNQEAIAASCKDSGQWVSSIPGNKSGEISTDGLYDSPATNDFDKLANLIITGPNEVNFVFGTETIGDTVYKGKVMVSSTTLTGDDNALATYSGTLPTVGPVTTEVNA